MATKIFGWFLLIAGLLLIIWTLYSSYNIFTGKAEAPEVFKMEKEIAKVPTQRKLPTSPTELQKELEKMINQQLKELLPVEIIPKALNLVAWSILAGLLIFGGSQIASLGIKLIKK